ncbi:MAG: hypothetical protein C0494_12650 [Sphingobium sp.]|nr:hypothetical protein [Sphingobium sp.]
MTDLLDLAARLEAACDITGKPIGRHMIATTNAMSEIFVKDSGREAQDMATVIGTLSACIDNEAKLFDALAIVAKEAADILHTIGDTMADTIITNEGGVFEGAAFAIVGHTADDASPRDGQFAVIFNVSDNAAAWSVPWVIGYWSEEAHQWFDDEGYPLTPSHVMKLPTAEVFMKAEGINP